MTITQAVDILSQISQLQEVCSVHNDAKKLDRISSCCLGLTCIEPDGFLQPKFDVMQSKTSVVECFLLLATAVGYEGNPLLTGHRCVSPAAGTGKKSAKSKEELVQEKKKELEKRLQDVSGQLNNNKKPPKKGTCVVVCRCEQTGHQIGF